MLCASLVLVATAGSGVGQLSVVSWNVLAPSFAPAGKFTWAAPSELSWNYRQQRIVEQLGQFDADVVCLQEVEVRLWPRLQEQLGGLGYDGLLQDTKHAVANAVLLKRGRVECVRRESRSRAMITVLRGVGAGGVGAGGTGIGGGLFPLGNPANGVNGVNGVNGIGGSSSIVGGRNGLRGSTVAAAAAGPPSLYLANVHLEAGASKAAQKQRVCQLRSLFRRLEHQRALDVAVSKGRPRALAPSCDVLGAAVIIAGDFNFDQRSALYRLLSSGKWPRLRQRNGVRLADEEAEVARQSFTHPLLPLTDVYALMAPPWGPQLRSTYRNGRMLDYVWVSEGVSVLRAMPVSDLAGSAHPHRLPSAEHPSDHLPIGALLSWPGAPPPQPDRCAWQQMYVENVVHVGVCRQPRGAGQARKRSPT